MTNPNLSEWTAPTYTTMSWKEFNQWKPIHPSVPPHLAEYVPFDAEEAKRAIYGIAGANVPGGMHPWEKQEAQRAINSRTQKRSTREPKSSKQSIPELTDLDLEGIFDL